MAGSPQRARLPPIPGVVRRNTLHLAGATALFSTAFVTFLSLAPPLMVALTGTLAFAGAPQSLNAFVRMALSYPLGRAMDRYGRRPPLAGALVVGGGAALIVFYAVATRSLGLFLGALTFLSMGYAVGHQIRVAATDMFPPERKGEGVGYLMSGNIVGALAGPFVIEAAQPLARGLDLTPDVASWLFMPLFMGAGAWLILSVRPDPREIGRDLAAFYPALATPAGEPGPASYPFSEMSLHAMLRYYPSLVAVVVSALGWGVMTMMMGLVPVALSHHGHGVRATAWAIAFHSVGMFGPTILVGQVSDRYGRKVTLGLGALISGIGSLITGVSASYWGITLGIGLVGVGWAGTFVGMTALIGDVTSPMIRGRALGMADAAGGLLSLTFPLLGGVVIRFFGFPVLGLLGLVASLPIVAMALALRESSPGLYRHATVAQGVSS